MNGIQSHAVQNRQTCRQWIAVILAGGLISCVHAPEPQSACEQPATLEGHFDPAAPGAMVMVRQNANLAAVAARLPETYRIDPRAVDSLHGFTVQELTEAIVAHLRCEPEIESISYDQVLHPESLNQ